MSASQIKAGAAYVELGTRQEKLDQGLARAKARLSSWAMSIAAVAHRALAASAAVLGVLGVATERFMHSGAELQKFSNMTGISVETLSGLAYAAGQTGAGLEDVVQGMRGIAKFTAALAGGNKTAAKTLSDLGISAAEFLAATPEEKLKLIADGLSRIPDETMRNAEAMRLLGRGGMNLVNLLSGGADRLQHFLDRAKELGIIVSADEAQQAAALKHEWKDLLAIFNAASIKIGAALAPALTGLLDVLISVAKGTLDFLKAHIGLVLAAATGAVVLGTFAGVLYAADIAIYLGTVALTIYEGVMWLYTAATTAAAAATGVLEMELLPLTLAIAALVVIAGVVIVVLGYLVATFTTVGQVASDTFNQMSTTVTATVQGIYDAIVGGRLDLAAKVALAGLYAVWVQGVGALETLWSDFKQWLFTLFINMSQGLYDLIFGELQGLINGFNSIAGQVGITIDSSGLAGIQDWVNQQLADARKDVSGAHDRAIQDVKDRINAANDDLKKATDEALAARQKKEAALHHEKQKRYIGGGMTGPAELPGGTLGTFSGAVAGLLGRSAPDSAMERTAKATEAAVDELEDIKGLLAEGGLNFG